MSVSDRAVMIQGQRTMEKNLGHFCMSNMSREIFKAEELPVFKSRSCNILTTRELGSSQMTNVNMSKGQSILTTECPSGKISFPQDSKLSDLKKQVLKELKFKPESREQSQAQGCAPDFSLTSDSLPS